VEQAARVLRYRFLAAQAKKARAAVVVVGHTLDDQAETVLLHLIRGSGLDGLSGMRPRSSWPLGRGPEVARPLLLLRREETGRYCQLLGVDPREDATNEMLLATRNRVRHEVMPALRRLNPRVEEALARLAEAAYEDAAELKGQAEEAFEKVGRQRKSGLALDLVALRGLSPTLRRRVLRLGLSRVLGSAADIETAHVAALDRLVASRPGRVSLPHGVVVVRDSRSLTVRRGAPPVSPAIPQTALVVPGVTEAGGWRFESEYEERRSSARRPYEVELDADAVVGGLWVRARRPGDRMRPAGLEGTKKLQDIMVDAKVPRGERDGVPVVVAEWGIAWVVGLCVDERVVRGDRVVRIWGKRLRR
jgi:tRNA(Ile)-lysidine synthase